MLVLQIQPHEYAWTIRTASVRFNNRMESGGLEHRAKADVRLGSVHACAIIVDGIGLQCRNTGPLRVRDCAIQQSGSHTLSAITSAYHEADDGPYRIVVD